MLVAIVYNVVTVLRCSCYVIERDNLICPTSTVGKRHTLRDNEVHICHSLSQPMSPNCTSEFHGRVSNMRSSFGVTKQSCTIEAMRLHHL